MEEKIYTIPVNDAFDKKEGCPFCELYKMLENNELDIILGASMMEPDIRIKTNEQGFCKKHFEKMFNMKNRLGLALMLESHLAEKKKEVFSKSLFGAPGEKGGEKIEKMEHSCYVCGRIEHNFDKMTETAALLWDRDKTFRKKVEETPYFCLPHFKKYTETARRFIGKKEYADFYKSVCEVTKRYYEELEKDVSWFVKKFDYRYDAEPWGNSKDAVERAIKFLKSEQ